MLETHKLSFQPGLIVNQEFFDYAEMQQSAKNWLYLAKYRLGTGPFYGYHDGVQLHHLQFGHADRHEGLMFEGFSPKDCLTIGLLQKSAGTAIINRLKMKPGDIAMIDDSKPYDFVSSHRTKLTIISIHKSLIAKEVPFLLPATDRLFKDSHNILSDTIENEWGRILNEPNLFANANELKVMEKKIVDAIRDVFTGQRGEECHLTEGEQTAFEVKDFVLDSLEEKMTIQSILEQFDVSYKTLENSFKSLFGITPKHFIELLKLNRAHKDLCQIDAGATNISDIASRWGFSHFGRFSEKYKALFGVLPSETLMATSISSN